MKYSYPIGCFIEDHEFIQGSGDLDLHNGRFSVTPDYPSGNILNYAYYIYKYYILNNINNNIKVHMLIILH